MHTLNKLKNKDKSEKNRTNKNIMKNIIPQEALKPFVVIYLFLFNLCLPLVTYAAEADMFIFFEKTTGNSYIALRYFSFVFTIVQYGVTLAGLLIIAFKVLTMAASITVLVSPPFFTMVHGKKNNLKKQYDVSGRQGDSSSKDIFFYYASCCIPDFVAISDFADTIGGGDDRGGGSSGDKKWDSVPTIGEYMKKEMVSFVVITLFGAMLYSGQTQRIVANFARGGQVIAEKVATIDISGTVDRALSSGKDFKFAYGNSIEGDNKKRVSDAVYKAAKGAVPDARDSTYLSTLGSNIQSQVDSYISNVQDGYSNPSLQFKVSFIENASNVKEIPATDDGFGGQSGMKKIALSSIAPVPKSPPDYYSTGAIIIEYTAQKSSTQGVTNN